MFHRWTKLSENLYNVFDCFGGEIYRTVCKYDDRIVDVDVSVLSAVLFSVFFIKVGDDL